MSRAEGGEVVETHAGLPGRLNKKSLMRATIEEYARDIVAIWPRDNERTPSNTLLYVNSHASKVCEEIRKTKWGRAIKQMGEVFVWWLSLVHLVTSPLPVNPSTERRIAHVPMTPSHLVWAKYPGACPVCAGRWLVSKGIDYENWTESQIDALIPEFATHFGANPQCRCMAFSKDTEDRSESFKKFSKRACVYIASRRRGEMPTSLHEYSLALRKIFENNVDAFTIDSIAFHLLEEVGEVTEAYVDLFAQDPGDDDEDFRETRRAKVAAFAEELADVFGWCVMLHAKLAKHLESTEDVIRLYGASHREDEGDTETDVKTHRKFMEVTRSMAYLVWTVYGRGDHLACERCGESVCDQSPETHGNKRGYLEGALDERLARLLNDGGVRFANPAGPDAIGRRLMPTSDSEVTGGGRKRRGGSNDRGKGGKSKGGRGGVRPSHGAGRPSRHP